MAEDWRAYIASFCENDTEVHPTLISNEAAEAFLEEQIPHLDCPDKELERIYYFRWWTFRKHLRKTPRGHIVTEFLPNVPWSGAYNSIVCPVGFHIREGRWLKDSEGRLKENIRFWLGGHGSVHDYSCWLPHAVWEYCSWKQDWAFAVELLPAMVEFFIEREAIHQRRCGLYWSDDNRDGMEYSISGPGLRPTLNSYAWADAVAISRIAMLAGEQVLSDSFTQKAARIKEAMDRLLWDGQGYKTIPLEESADPVLPCRPNVEQRKDVRELVGFIPWYFRLPEPGKGASFAQLLDQEGFSAPYGLTTAEQRHPGFMEKHDHECLWNGPVWPFATSQTLVAAANLLREQESCPLAREDYYAMLRRYALSHSMRLENGKTVPWIDENMDPYTGRWLARDILKSWGWRPELGGYERGKDYNHSLFCDLVLSGLLGIHAHEDGISVSPLIPEDWTYFRVENLWHKGKAYTVTYDADGSHYGGEAGFRIERMDKEV